MNRAVVGVYIGWAVASFVFVALIVLASRRRNTGDNIGPGPEALDGGDPLDSLDPNERELFLEAWWHDVLAMPENEMDKPELAYLEWVHNLPEAVA